MIESRIKKYSIMIMDASNINIVYSIAKWCGLIANLHGQNKVNFDSYVLDPQYLRIIVMELTIDQDTFASIKFIIDDLYPGLCVFDPPMIIR